MYAPDPLGATITLDNWHTIGELSFLYVDGSNDVLFGTSNQCGRGELETGYKRYYQRFVGPNGKVVPSLKSTNIKFLRETDDSSMHEFIAGIQALNADKLSILFLDNFQSLGLSVIDFADYSRTKMTFLMPTSLNYVTAVFK
jgi:hypothetical protein